MEHPEGDSVLIDLLIGNDLYYSCINRRMVKVQIDESIALDTYLGGCILLGVLIDKKVNIENSIDRNLTHMLKISSE